MTTYFIIGASRGVGLAYVKNLTKDKSNLVIAGVRSKAGVDTLKALGLDNLKVIHTDLADSYADFVKNFKVLDEISPKGIDVFISNGAIEGPNFFVPSYEYDVDKSDEVMSINYSGPAKAYSAAHKYIFKGTGVKKIIFVTSALGSTAAYYMGSNAYGSSKAALNHLGVQISKENHSSDDELAKSSVTILMHPGLVDTDMAVNSKKNFPAETFITAEESANTQIEVIKKLTAEDNGKLFANTGDEMGF